MIPLEQSLKDFILANYATRAVLLMRLEYMLKKLNLLPEIGADILEPFVRDLPLDGGGCSLVKNCSLQCIF